MITAQAVCIYYVGNEEYHDKKIHLWINHGAVNRVVNGERTEAVSS